MRLKLSATVAVLVCLLLFSPQSANGKAWKSIVPLHSTRADVEALLGPPTGEDLAYDVDGEHVVFSYSSQGCQEGLPGGWKVAANTVVSISVSPKNEMRVTDLLASGKHFDQIYAIHTTQVDYLDAQEGVRYATIDEGVFKVTYLATAVDDKQLRCGEYKYAGPVPPGAKNKFEQVPFDSFGRIPFTDAEARLDNFVLQLEDMNVGTPHYRGYIVAYAGRSAHAAEASTMAECVKNYLGSARKVGPETVITADGGYRNEFTVELYIMPNDAYPPQLMPTVSPKNVEILEGRFTPCTVPE